MAVERPLILGEHRRLLDERFRVSLPAEWVDHAFPPSTAGILAKERIGALSLWNATVWQERLDAAVGLIQAKINAGRLDDRIEEVQHLGRLLSARHRPVQLAGRGRLSIPEGFREFLGVEPGGDVLLIGAAVCVEIWQPHAWLAYQQQRMPEFGTILDQLSR
jgi:MraZ protein